MGDWVTVEASDGHELSAYIARPQGAVRGGVVVVQEIFGVNPSIRAVVDEYASRGYVAIAPALFDRFEKGIELGYSGGDAKKALSFYAKLDPALSVKDVGAAFEHIGKQGKGTAVLGFCYGGLVAWLSATRGPANGFRPACTVSYYPGGVGKVATEAPSCPTLLHFGAEDNHIGSDQVEAVRDAHPDAVIYVYEGAGHAFANPNRSSYVSDAATLADERSLQFLNKHIA